MKVLTCKPSNHPTMCTFLSRRLKTHCCCILSIFIAVKYVQTKCTLRMTCSLYIDKTDNYPHINALSFACLTARRVLCHSWMEMDLFEPFFLFGNEWSQTLTTLIQDIAIRGTVHRIVIVFILCYVTIILYVVVECFGCIMCIYCPFGYKFCPNHIFNHYVS